MLAGLGAPQIEAIIPTKAEPIRSKQPLQRFCDDARHDHVTCPRDKILRPDKVRINHDRGMTAKVRDCKDFDLAAIRLSRSRVTKALVIVHDYLALLRARRRRERRGKDNGSPPRAWRLAMPHP